MAANSDNATKEEAFKLPEADVKRYRELFRKLDANNDGRIEVSELTSELKRQGAAANQASGLAQEIITKADESKEGTLDFREFVNYMIQHERDLKLAFSDLDRNEDGQIEPPEIVTALKKLGFAISEDEAVKLTKRIDQDGNLKLDWDEWRDFLQLYPSGNLESIVQHWRASMMIDIGDSLRCPAEFTEKEKKSGMWWRHLVAGGFAGAISRTCTAPLDRLKVMFQVTGGQTSMAACLKKMVSEGGVKSLWRGNGTNVLKIAPESAIKFAAYEQFKRLITGGKKEIGVPERFIAGASAGAFAQTCIYPLEVVKTRLAISTAGEYKGIADTLYKVASKEGFKALYRGYVPNLLGIIPYAGIDLTIYETLKQMYLRKNPNQTDPGIMILLACGTTSSTCGQLASYPLALVRTKLQAAGASSNDNFLSLAKRILREEGPQGLYRGLTPNFLKVLPAVGISYIVYEKAKSALVDS